jgi:hypothetical protein
MENEEILKNAYIEFPEEFTHYLGDYLEGNRYFQIIFSHSFAKAFWGKEPDEISGMAIQTWQYHLMQMVLEENPIKYLEKFI